ncbi:MAG: preprotein translocase subunit SecG [Myxococcales bacterium]|jgi:preprotein translocase subunit SecG
MYTFVSIIYVFVCLFLIMVVLLQSGKGGGLGSAFGGGTSQQIFGGAGAGNLLTRLTAIFAFAFMGLSVWLAFLSTTGEQALDRAVREQTAAQQAPASDTEAEEPQNAGEPGDATGVTEEPSQDPQSPEEATAPASEHQ